MKAGIKEYGMKCPPQERDPMNLNFNQVNKSKAKKMHSILSALSLLASSSNEEEKKKNQKVVQLNSGDVDGPHHPAGTMSVFGYPLQIIVF